MASRKNQWTEGQEKLLFKLQTQYGNRWSVIATKLAPKNDSCVKNKFYSTLRKGLRKINKYITDIKKKSDPVRLKGYKTLQQMFITKLIAVVDNNFEQKYEVKQKALDLSQNIQKRVIEIARNEKQYLKQQSTDYTMQEQLLSDIHQFNKNCKKRKGKRKAKGQSEVQSENDELENSQEIEQQILPTQHSEKDNNKNISRTVQKNDSFTRNNYLLPQTKQNIILTGQNNSDIDAQPKIMITLNIQKNNNQEQLSHNEKKESISSSICNPLSLCQKTEESQTLLDENNIQNSTSYNINANWFFQSISSRDLSKNISGYLIHPSPLPSDTSNPFTFGNLMKNNNFTNNAIFDQKNNSVDMLASSKFFQNVMEQKTLSLLDQLPMFVPNGLLKSSDMLQQSTEIMSSSQTFNSSQLYKQPCLSGKQTSISMSFQKKLNGSIQAFFPVISNNKYFKTDTNALAQQYSFAGQSHYPKIIEDKDRKVFETDEVGTQKINEQ